MAQIFRFLLCLLFCFSFTRCSSDERGELVAAATAPRVREFPYPPASQVSLARTKPSAFATYPNSQGFTAAGDDAKLPGHSALGEAFNGGPRSRPVSMGRAGDVKFPLSTQKSETFAWVQHGVGLLHSFATWEAERAFRQARFFDARNPIPYWGMAMANSIFKRGSAERANDFLRQALAFARGASAPESWYMYCLAALYEDQGGTWIERRQEYVKRWEKMVERFPTEIEAKAFLVLARIENATFSEYGGEVLDLEKNDGLISEILAVKPLHPSHHYRIQLWRRTDPARAETSAWLAWKAAPAAPLMWSLPGQVFAALGQPFEALWQREAAAVRSRMLMFMYGTMPYQSEGFLDNAAELIENYLQTGAFDEAARLSRNLIELPLHPVYNRADFVRGSLNRGQLGLIETLERRQSFSEVFAGALKPFLETSAISATEIRRLRLLGAAAYATRDSARGDEYLRDLEELAVRRHGELAVDAELKSLWEVSRDVVQAFRFVDRANPSAASDKMRAIARIDLLPPGYSAFFARRLGNRGTALDLTRRALTSRPAEVSLRGLRAVLEDELTTPAGDREKAIRDLTGQLSRVDWTVPIFSDVKKLLGDPAVWEACRRLEADPRATGRMAIPTIGPAVWVPPPRIPPAPAGSQYRVVVFYHGAGCPLCDRLLGAWSARAVDFKAAHTDVFVVSPDPEATIKGHYAGHLAPELQFFADPEFKLFKEFKIFDDLEGKPLHGVFLLDRRDRMRWGDAGADPFALAGGDYEGAARFLLGEIERQAKF